MQITLIKVITVKVIAVKVTAILGEKGPAFPAFCLRSLDAIRSVELWMKASCTKIHFDEKTSCLIYLD